MKSITIRLLAVVSLLLLAACATMPTTPPEVVRLENQLAQVKADQRIAPNAPDAINKAQAAVDAVARQAGNVDEPIFEHHVYVANRLIQTAQALGLARYEENRGKRLGGERDQLLLQVKTREAQNARQDASVARASADAERRNADMAREETARTQDQLQAMRAKLSDLKTKQTKRGLVVTLGDVLFEVDKARLKSGATRSLEQLAQALRDDPDAHVSIEGHTDSTGSREHNMELSRDRAQSVESYLVSRGVNPAHITARGLGPDYPVATNKTSAGRQQNRRVEVIVKNPENTGTPTN